VFRASRVAALALVTAATVAAAGCENPAAPNLRGVLFNSTDLRAGTGADARTGRTVAVNYTGWLYDGTNPELKGKQFDASKAGQPFVFWLGAGQVIEGWEEGIVGMKVGGLRRLVIPPDMAYGRAGSGRIIPPNASLVFDIELVSVY
jgi:FKBP-type peptidyl-prolyl cis-trans isomerase FkpA